MCRMPKPRRGVTLAWLVFVAAFAAPSDVAFSHGPKHVQIKRGSKLAHVLAAIRSSNSRQFYTAKDVATAPTEAPQGLELAVLQYQEATRLREEVSAARQAATASKQAHLEKCWRRALANISNVCLSAMQLEKILNETTDTGVTRRQAEKLFQILSADGKILYLKDYANLFPTLSKQLEEIQALEQSEQAMVSKLKMRKLWEDRQRDLEVEQQTKWLESQSFIPQLPLQPTLKAFSLGAYILPVLDMILLWTWPATNIIVRGLAIFLFVCAVFATIEKSIPKKLRFHLNQAVLLDSLLQVVKLAITGSLILIHSFPHTHVVASLLARSVVVLFVICIWLSLTESVQKNPAASADSVQRSEIANVSWLDADFFHCLPSPSWFPYLGIIASSVVFADYFQMVMTTLEKSLRDVVV